MGTIGSASCSSSVRTTGCSRKAEIQALTPEQVKAAATTLDPGKLTWVVVGDLKQTEQPCAR
jgi:hypothetical protein